MSHHSRVHDVSVIKYTHELSDRRFLHRSHVQYYGRKLNKNRRENKDCINIVRIYIAVVIK